MTTLTAKNKYAILMKYKNKTEKQDAIDELIDIILEGHLPPDELTEAKEDAKTLAESLLRCNTKTPDDVQKST